MGKETHAWGIASLVLSIIGILLIFAPYIGIVLSILAVVFYGIQKKHESTGIATAGLVIGIIGIVFNGIMLIFFLSIFAFMGSLGDYEEVETETYGDVIGEDSSLDNEQELNQENPVETESSDEDSKKVKKATLTIERVVESVANLGDIRITVNNIGDVSIRPKFDVIVTDSSGNKICEDSPYTGVGSISAGEEKTDEISILSCTFEEDGTYDVKVDMLDQDYNKMDSDSKELEVNYWGNNEQELNQENPVETESSDEDSKKVKKATLTIDRVIESVANLGDIRITVNNIGDVSIRPKFDVIVTDSSGNKICEDSPYTGVGSISAGEEKTDEISILSCTFEEDGTYDVKVDMLDQDYNKMDSDSKELEVNYWGKFEI